MNKKELLEFIEDKQIEIDDKWYYHATSKNINCILKILNQGIKSSCLRNEKSEGYNGNYYISLARVNDKSSIIYSNFRGFFKFILNEIHPIETSQKNFQSLTNTVLPLRYSYYCGEYHSFIKINSSKIIALEYSLEYLFNNSVKELKFLKELILSLESNNINIPVYDFSSSKEINKNKIKLLSLEDFS